MGTGNLVYKTNVGSDDVEGSFQIWNTLHFQIL